MTTDLGTITIAQAARLIEAKELSPVELTEAKLSLIEGLDGQLDSFVPVSKSYEPNLPCVARV